MRRVLLAAVAALLFTPAIASAVPPPPVGPGQYAAGQTRNSTDTGLGRDDISPSQLTPVAGSYITYGSAYNGKTISLKSYHGEVVITGSHITITDCTLTNGGLDSVGFLMEGSYNVVQNCTITAPAGKSMYEPIWMFGDHNYAIANDISRGENLLTTYGTNVTIAGNYMHDVSLDSNPSDHPDAIEVYGGGPTLIRNNRIEEDDLYDAPINVAPWGGYRVTGLTVYGNFIDDGQSVILLDSQNPQHPVDGITNTRIYHNAFGGHQCPASNQYCFHIYHPSLNYDGRHFVQTEAQLAADPSAVLWPTSGTNVNKWEESSDLVPNRDGQVVVPT